MEKCRVMILTDIGEYTNEPDDAESLIRLMLYSNEIDIEGIIPTASHCAPDTSDPGYLDRCRRAVEAYKKAYPNLKKHAEGYPDPDELMKTVRQGTSHVYLNNYDYHLKDDEHNAMNDLMEYIMLRQKKILTGDYELTVPNIGDGCSNDGSDLILESFAKDDPRPIWFCLWGGAGTLAQALYDYRKNHTYEEVIAVSKKIRVYDIDGQDDVGGWICKEFPEVKWLRSDIEFWGFSQALSSESTASMYPITYDLGDMSCINNEWVMKNVQSKGPLGEAYPTTKFGVETDTPSLLYTICNGLNDPEHQNWGGWGGRYTADRSKNPPAVHFEGDYLIEPKPFFAYRDDVDNYTDVKTGKTWINDPFMPIGRWREDYQNDMAARMIWSITDKYEDANHNPIAVVNGDATKDILFVKAKPGDSVLLDATASSDPDGDAISFSWYIYSDPGTYHKEIVIADPDKAKAEVMIPKDADNDEIHVILEVKDNGKDFPLKAYRRVVISTGNGGRAGTAPFTVNDADVNPSALAHFEYIGSWEHVTDQFGCHDSDVHRSATEGDKAVLHFTGRQVKLFGVPLNNCGIAAVWVDGEEVGKVDFYSQMIPWKDQHSIEMTPTTGETLLYSSKVLDYGEHTLTIVVCGEKNDKSAGVNINIDKAEIFI